MTIQITRSREDKSIPPSITTSEEVETSQFPLHSEIEKRKEKQLFRELFKRKIVDQFGNLTDQFKHIELPSLTNKETNLIHDFLFKEFIINLPNSQVKQTSLGELIHYFKTQSYHSESVASTWNELVGSLVVYFLFKYLPDYPKRLFMALKCEDLYDAYQDLFIEYHLPHDGDVRFLLTPSRHLNKKELYALADYFPEAIGETKASSGFEFRSCLIGHVDLVIIDINNMSREDGLHFELILCQSLPKDSQSVFHLDSLYLPLFPFFVPNLMAEVRPGSRCEIPLQPIVDHLLGHIKAIDTCGIDGLGLLRLISWKIKGKILAQNNLEKHLIHTFLASTKKIDGTILKWLNTHHEGDQVGALFFKLQTYFTLSENLEDVSILSIDIREDYPSILQLFVAGLLSKKSSHQKMADFFERLLSYYFKVKIPLQGVTLDLDSDVTSHVFYRLSYRHQTKTYTLQFPLSSRNSCTKLFEIQKFLILEFPSLLSFFSKPLQKYFIGLMEKVVEINQGDALPLVDNPPKNVMLNWLTLLLQKKQAGDSLFVFAAKCIETHPNDFKKNPELVISTVLKLIENNFLHLAKSILRAPYLKGKSNDVWVHYYHKKLQEGKTASCIYLHLKDKGVKLTLRHHKSFLKELCLNLKRENSLGALMELEKSKCLSLDDLLSYRYAVAVHYFSHDPELGIDALYTLIKEEEKQAKHSSSFFCAYFEKLQTLKSEKSFDLLVFALTSSFLANETLNALCMTWFSHEKNPQSKHYKFFSEAICKIDLDHDIIVCFLDQIERHTTSFEKSPLFSIKKEIEQSFCSIIHFLDKQPSQTLSSRILILTQTCRLTVPTTEFYALFFAKGLLESQYPPIQLALLLVKTKQMGFFAYKQAQPYFFKLLHSLFEDAINQTQLSRALIYIEWLLSFDSKIFLAQDQFFFSFQTFFLQLCSTSHFSKAIDLLQSCYTPLVSFKNSLDSFLSIAFGIAKKNHSPSVYVEKLITCHFLIQEMSIENQTFIKSVIQNIFHDLLEKLKKKHEEKEIAGYLFLLLERFTLYLDIFPKDQWSILLTSLKQTHPEKLYACAKILDSKLDIFKGNQRSRLRFWSQLNAYYGEFSKLVNLELFYDQDVWALIDQTEDDYPNYAALHVLGILKNLDHIESLKEKKKILSKCYKVLQKIKIIEKKLYHKIHSAEREIEVDNKNLKGYIDNGQLLFSSNFVKNVQTLYDFHESIWTKKILFLNKNEALTFTSISQVEITWMIKAFDTKCLIEQAKQHAKALSSTPLSSTVWACDIPELFILLAQYRLYDEIVELLPIYCSILLPKRDTVMLVGHMILSAKKNDPLAISRLSKIWYRALYNDQIEISPENCLFASSLLKSLSILNIETHQIVISDLFYLILKKFGSLISTPPFSYRFFDLRLDILPLTISSEFLDQSVSEFIKLTLEIQKIKKNRDPYYEKMIDCIVAFSSHSYDRADYLDIAIKSFSHMLKQPSSSSYKYKILLIKKLLLPLTPLKPSSLPQLNIIARELTYLALVFSPEKSKKIKLTFDNLFSLIIWKAGFFLNPATIKNLIMVKTSWVKKGKVNLPNYYEVTQNERQIRQSSIKVGKLLFSDHIEEINEAIRQAAADERIYLDTTPRYHTFIYAALTTYIFSLSAEEKKLQFYTTIEKYMGSLLTEEEKQQQKISNTLISSKKIFLNTLLKECKWRQPNACVDNERIQHYLILILTTLENDVKRKTFHSDPNVYIEILSQVSRPAAVLLRLKEFEKYQERFAIPNMGRRFIEALEAETENKESLAHYNVIFSIIARGWAVAWKTPFDQFEDDNNEQIHEELPYYQELALLESFPEKT